MRVSINWIKDFVDLSGVNIDDLIYKFTMGVAEVEGVEYKGKDISNVVVGQILSVENVPNSKKLHLLKVDTKDEILQIVCGASNVRVGLKTPLAKIGAKLGDVTIGKATLAGVESFGMCCGGDEIGISDDHSGIVELDDDAEVGKDIKQVLDIEDIVFEIDNKSLTNRPDLWGHYGIAREIASLVNRPLKSLDLEDESSFKNKKNINLDVKSDSCYRYTTACMSNITRKKSPLNMQIRLYYCGMRGINFLADITNYIMLELGQPMHAFDGDIVKKIEVYNLNNDLKFKTLDSAERLLKKGCMVIATNDEPVAIAGIMGGENSEVTDKTTSVLIESANFDSYKVRTTAISLGLRTEASGRYEKSLDPELTKIALLRYVKLVKKYDIGAVVSSSICDLYNKRYPKLEIEISKDFIDKYVGISISEDTILKILTSLEFKLLENKSGKYKFEVPSFRATKDINGKADLVEEVTRIYGYDNITPKSIRQIIKPTILDRNIQLEYDIKYALADRFNLNETHSYLWYDEAFNSKIQISPTCYIKCVNSLSKENSQIRSSIIPSLLKVIDENKTYFDDFGTFEIGRVVKGLKTNSLVDETKSLGIVLYSKTKENTNLLFEAKTILDYILEYVANVKYSLNLKTPTIDYYHPKNYYTIYCNKKEIGDIFILHPKQSDTIEDNCSIVGLEINFTSLVDIQPSSTKFEKFSKFPITKLDFNFIIPKGSLYKDIITLANSLKSEFNYNVSLLDIYENENGSKSYTLHYELTSFERNITSDDIDKFHSNVINTFKQKGIELKL